jgi:hypothetical protein
VLSHNYYKFWLTFSTGSFSTFSTNLDAESTLDGLTTLEGLITLWLDVSLKSLLSGDREDLKAVLDCRGLPPVFDCLGLPDLLDCRSLAEFPVGGMTKFVS